MAFLYRYYNERGDLLYIGESLSFVRRMAEHHKKAKWFDAVCSVKLEKFATKQQARVAESEAIAQEDPIYNIAFKKKDEVVTTSPTCNSSCGHMTHFKDILDLKKLNAGDAAKICGVTERTIYYWINGKIIPKKAYIHIIENYKQ